MDAELPEEAMGKMAIHLKSCRDCSETLSRLQRLTTLLGEVSAPEVPKNFADRVLDCGYERSRAIQSIQRKRLFIGRWWSPRFLTARAAVAAAFLVIGLGLGVLMGQDTWQSPGLQSVEKSQMAQVEPTDIYNLDYLSSAPKGSLAYAYVTLTSATNGRER